MSNCLSHSRQSVPSDVQSDVQSEDLARPYSVLDLDGACRELNARGVGLALVIDAEGHAEPVPYRLSVEHGVSEALLDPRGWVS